MPQLDFSIWMINLITCWSMFFLIYISTNNIISTQNVSKTSISSAETNSNNWPW